jgi:hypothetical protein
MKFNEFFQPHYPLVFSPTVIDLERSHQYVDEFYRVHCPRMQFQEIDRKQSTNNEDLSKLWGENVGGFKVGRDLHIHMFPDYNVEERQIHKKHATEIEREIRFSVGILQLKAVDLYPEMGDHVLYGGYNYEIYRVYVRPDDLFQHHNLPLHVSMDAVIYRPGDRVHRRSENKV